MSTHKITTVIFVITSTFTIESCESDSGSNRTANPGISSDEEQFKPGQESISDPSTDQESKQMPDDPKMIKLLTLHNDGRHMVNRAQLANQPLPEAPLKDLTWNAALAQVAQNWANKCTFSHSESNQRKTEFESLGGMGVIGENFFWGSSETQAFSYWFDEYLNYSHSDNECTPASNASNPQCGHYTQIVWDETKELGCGYKEDCTRNGREVFYLICNYSPAGNYPRAPYSASD